jgi:hypothetical protein
MQQSNESTSVNRRDVLRSSAVLGGGLLASAIPGGRAAAAHSNDGSGGVGYISESTYGKLTGDDQVDCADGHDGWGGTAYLQRPARDDDGDTGLSVAAPPSCDDDETDRHHSGFLITAEEGTDLEGGPSGDGPWGEECGSWLFVEDEGTVETGTAYRVTAANGSPSVCHEDVTATDSDGVELGSPMDLVRVAFEPVPADSQWTQATKFAGDEFDRFGVSVALDETTAVVGARDDEDPNGESAGSASVFVHSGVFWYRQAKLDADDGDPDDAFGNAVAIDGDTAVITAPGDEDPNGEFAGSAYVFTRSAGVWSQQAKLVADDGRPDDRFGAAVDIDGDTVVVGADEAEAPNGTEPGAAYVFTRSGEDWSQQAKLAVDDFGVFGADVAVDDDTIAVGAPTTGVESFPFAGATYVFTRSGDDWSQQARLTAHDPDEEDNLGDSVAIHRDTVVAGALNAETDTAGFRAGSAYVFTRSGSDWSQQARLTAPDPEPYTWFGYDVAIDGDTALVGSDIFDGAGNTAQGEAYVFTRSGGEWHLETELTADDGDEDDKFGISVAIDGDVALLGASGDEDPGGSGAGSAYVFEDE